MTKWEIHISDKKSYIADATVSGPDDVNLIARGETATYEFVNIQTKLTVKSGTTYVVESGTTEQIDIVVVDGGTLDINGTLQADYVNVKSGTIDNDGTLDINEKYAFEVEEIQNYSPFSGKYVINETLGSKQQYSEFIPSTAQIDTLLLGIEPLQDLKDKTVEGYWGLINTITDDRNTPLSNSRITLDIDVLATYEEYSDHTAVEADLKR